MAPKQRQTFVESLTRPDRLSGRRSSVVKATSAAEAEIARLAARNYGRGLRRCLNRAEVREIVQEGTRVWPDLNKQPVTLVSTDEFVRRWSTLGVDFKFASLQWEQGLSLLGFYMKQNAGLRKRPLICVNTAHHPAIVGVALDHEMGHHLTTKIFGSDSAAPHLLSLTGYREHLSDPVELAADTLVSLCIYPLDVAKLLFDNESDPDLRPNDPAFQKVLQYIATRYGLKFERIAEAEKRFQAFAALVHYTKLRRALLDEYSI